MTRQASLFISHGAPMLALDPGAVGEAWRDLASRIPRPEAILCISAHWETARPVISGADRPQTIHDFFGFEPALSEIQYPAPGAPDLAREVSRLVKGGGLDISVDEAHGLDHGAWVPLSILYPDADIPVAQLSVQPGLGLDHHFTLGRVLAPLRDQGVMILASGGLTHNLREFGRYYRDRDGAPMDYALSFDAWVSERVETANWDCLMHLDHAPDFARNHPSIEHILPLLVAAGAAQGAGRPFSEIFEYRVFSMKGFIFD